MTGAPPWHGLGVAFGPWRLPCLSFDEATRGQRVNPITCLLVDLREAVPVGQFLVHIPGEVVLSFPPALCRVCNEDMP